MCCLKTLQQTKEVGHCCGFGDLIVTNRNRKTKRTRKEFKSKEGGGLQRVNRMCPHIIPEECWFNYIKNNARKQLPRLLQACVIRRYCQSKSVSFTVQHITPILQTFDTNSLYLPIKKAFLPLCLSINLCMSSVLFFFLLCRSE